MIVVVVVEDEDEDDGDICAREFEEVLVTTVVKMRVTEVDSLLVARDERCCTHLAR